MHIKFIARGTGSGRGAVNYLTGEKDHAGITREEVKVLRGDPQMTAAVIDSLEFKHRYTSGVIAWSPSDNPTPEQIGAVLQDFERTAFAGLEKDQYSFTAIQHREENGGVHVHVLNARVDLASGKSLNIAPPGHQKTFDQVRDYHNELNGWDKPQDIALERTYQLDNHTALKNADLIKQGLEVEPEPKELVTQWLLARVEAGLINDRQDIKTSLEELGEITREGEHYISVKPDGHERAMRFKGGIYESEFTAESYREIAEQDRGGISRDRAGDSKRATEILVGLEKTIEKRAEYNQLRYEKTAELEVLDSASADSVFDSIGTDSSLVLGDLVHEQRGSPAVGIAGESTARNQNTNELGQAGDYRSEQASNHRVQRPVGNFTEVKKEVKNDDGTGTETTKSNRADAEQSTENGTKIDWLLERIEAGAGLLREAAQSVADAAQRVVKEIELRLEKVAEAERARVAEVDQFLKELQESTSEKSQSQSRTRSHSPSPGMSR